MDSLRLFIEVSLDGFVPDLTPIFNRFDKRIKTVADHSSSYL